MLRRSIQLTISSRSGAFPVGHDTRSPDYHSVRRNWSSELHGAKEQPKRNAADKRNYFLNFVSRWRSIDDRPTFPAPRLCNCFFFFSFSPPSHPPPPPPVRRNEKAARDRRSFPPRRLTRGEGLIYRAKLHSSDEITNRSRDYRVRNFRLRKESSTRRRFPPRPPCRSSHSTSRLRNSVSMNR